MRYYDPREQIQRHHELAGDGVPWTDEPAPGIDPGVAAHYSGRMRMIKTDRYPGMIQIGSGRVLARHFGAGGRSHDAPEWLPVWVDETGQHEQTTRHPEAPTVRELAGGEGSVRSTRGHMDVFHRREIGPRCPLRLHAGDRPPAGVEGPVEVAYFWDGYRHPPGMLSGLLGRWR